MNIRQALPIILTISIACIVALSIYAINQSTEISTLEERNDEFEQLSLEISKRDQSLAILQSISDETNKESIELISQIQFLLKQIETLSLSNDQRHSDPSIMSAIDCSGCHSEIMGLALAGESNIYHNTHLNNILLNFNCVDCHKSVDILSTSTDITRVIDIGICALCHSSFPVHKYTHFMDSPKEQFARQYSNCDRCHDKWKNIMKGATFVNLEIITNEDCTTCHLNNMRFVDNKAPIEIPCAKCHD